MLVTKFVYRSQYGDYLRAVQASLFYMRDDPSKSLVRHVVLLLSNRLKCVEYVGAGVAISARTIVISVSRSSEQLEGRGELPGCLAGCLAPRFLVQNP